MGNLSYDFWLTYFVQQCAVEVITDIVLLDYIDGPSPSSLSSLTARLGLSGMLVSCTVHRASSLAWLYIAGPRGKG